MDWLVTPATAVARGDGRARVPDDTGELTGVRQALTWYPDDVWRWLVACQWQRLAHEEAFVGRTADVGDEIGSPSWPPALPVT